MGNLDLSSLKNKKVALVLSGGVVKAGAWHLGVALALKELGFNIHPTRAGANNTGNPIGDINIDTFVGSSAGALISIILACGHSPENIIQSGLNPRSSSFPPLTYKDMLSFKSPRKKLNYTRQYDPWEGMPFYLREILRPISKVSGLFTTMGLVKYLKNNILTTDRFEDLPSDLFVVATQLDHSRKVVFSKYNYPNPLQDQTTSYYTGVSISEAAAASMSVPPFYSPFPIENPKTKQLDYYIDGEIRETLSTHVAVDNKCDFIISSWTHTPYHFHDEIGSLVNFGLPAICVQSIYLMIQKKIVAARAQRKNAVDIINTVNEYLNNNKIATQHKKNIMTILETKLNHKQNVRFLDIYPGHGNYELFFSSFFSLNPNVASEIIKMGHKKTMETFEKEFN